MARLTVLDASILLAHFDGGDAHSADAAAILVGADDLAASTVTLAEVLVGAARAGGLDEQIDAIELLGIVEIPLGAGSAARLARLRANTGLRMPDCCVLHAAVEAGAAAIATRDHRLARAAEAYGFATP